MPNYSRCQFLLLLCATCFCLTSTDSLDSPIALQFTGSQSKTLQNLDNLTRQAWRGTTSFPAYDYEVTTDIAMSDRDKSLLILFLFIQIYMIIAEVMVCQEYLVPAVLVISDVLKISKDVAGGTFLAFAVSTPLLLVNMMNLPDILILNPCPNLNLSFALALCCFFKKRLVNVIVTWWSIVRSMAYFSILVLVTVLLTLGGTLYWYHPSILILFYFIFCFFMVFNDRLRARFCDKNVRHDDVTGEETALNVREPSTSSETVPREGSSPLKYSQGISSEHANLGLEPKQSSPPPMYSSQTFYHPHTSRMLEGDPPKYTSQMIEPVGPHDDYPSYTEYPDYHMQNNYLANLSSVATQTATTDIVSDQAPLDIGITVRLGQRICAIPLLFLMVSPDEGDVPLNMEWPATFRQRFKFIIFAPIIYPIWLSLPDVRRTEKRKCYAVSYLGSVVWLLVFHFILSATIEIPGAWPPTGVALFASSVIIARKGLGDMAISVIYGSSIFDLAIGFPLPCLIVCLASGQVSFVLHVTEAVNPFIIQVAIFMYLCCSQRKLNLGLGFLTLILPFLSSILLILLYPELRESLLNGRHYAA